VAVWVISSLGGFMLLVTGFFFFKYAIDKGWLGPEVRFAGGVGFGLLCSVAAEGLWSRRYRWPASALGGAGIGILYAALYAGHAWYDLLGITPTFALMALVTAWGVVQAVRRDSQFVAILGLFGGYLTPILLSTGENKAVALFTYIGLLQAGLLLVASRRAWWSLVALTGPATAAVLLGWGLKFIAPDQAPTAFAAAVVLGGMLAVVAWRQASPRWVAVAAALGLPLVHLALLPYLPPLEVESALPAAAVAHPWLAAGFLVVTAAALQGIATRRGWPLLAALTPLVLLPGLVIFGLGWVRGVQPMPEWGAWGVLSEGLARPYGLEAMPPALLALGLVGPALLGALLAWRVTAAPPAEPAGKAEFAVPGLLPAHGALGLLLAGGIAALGCFASPLDLGSLLAVSLGLALLGWLLTGWTGPRWVPLVALGLLALALLVATGAEQEGLLVLGTAVVILYLVAPFALDRVPATRRITESPLPWLASALAGPALFIPMHQGWEESLGGEAIGLLPLALGAGTLAVAVVLRERLARLPASTLAVYVGVALLFACLAVPVQLEKEWLTVGWALEGAALAWMSSRVRHPGVRLLALTLMAAVTVRLVLNLEVLTYHSAAEPSLINWTLYGYGIPVLALLASALWLGPRESDPPRWAWLRFGRPAAILMAVAVAFMLINLEVSSAFPEEGELTLWSHSLQASMTRSICWAGYGLLLLLLGQRHGLRYLRPVALAFLLLAALKVFLIDLWQLSGLVRVGSLFGVAITLILAALAFQRLVLRDAGKDDEEDR
jgi:uncharacterized membrane protein